MTLEASHVIFVSAGYRLSGFEGSHWYGSLSHELEEKEEGPVGVGGA